MGWRRRTGCKSWFVGWAHAQRLLRRTRHQRQRRQDRQQQQTATPTEQRAGQSRRSIHCEGQQGVEAQRCGEGNRGERSAAWMGCARQGVLLCMGVAVETHGPLLCQAQSHSAVSSHSLYRTSQAKGGGRRRYNATQPASSPTLPAKASTSSAVPPTCWPCCGAWVPAGASSAATVQQWRQLFAWHACHCSGSPQPRPHPRRHCTPPTHMPCPICHPHTRLEPTAHT